MTKHRYSKEQLENAVATSYSYANVLRELGIPQAGGSQSYIKQRILAEGINTEHFTGMSWNRGKKFTPRRSAQDILVLKSPHDPKTKTADLRRSLLEIGRAEVCTECDISSTYNGKPIVLEIDHISGVNWDNRPENLRFLCPNCHSQQPTGKPWKNRVKD